MKAEKRAGINFFQRYLTVWMFLCMVVGVVLGHFAPALPTLLAKLEYARVSIPMAILIWIMIYPMMLKVDFKSVRDVGKKPKLHLNRRPARSAARIAKPGHRIDCPSATIPPHTKKPPGKHLVVFQETFVLFSRMWFYRIIVSKQYHSVVTTLENFVFSGVFEDCILFPLYR